MTLRARITGTGMHVPARVVSNDDLAQLMDTTDEWIRQRSGIATRHYVEPGQKASELAHLAVARALDAAGLEPDGHDIVILATLSPKRTFPARTFLHERLGLSETPCFDLSAQCSGFVYSLSVANAFVRSGQYRRVLVIGCEIHSTGVDHSTEGRDVAVLFGDGAGAVVVEANDDPENSAEILEVRLHAEGRHAEKLGWRRRSGFQPVRSLHELIDNRRPLPRSRGAWCFKHATTRMPRCCSRRSRRRASSSRTSTLMSIRRMRINEYVAQKLGIRPRSDPNIDR